jgi:hypothetical protein
MWQPDPSWTRLPAGPSSHGVWLATEGGREVVVKRLEAPAPHDPAQLADPHSGSWWRREADVALSGDLVATPGLRAPELVRAEEDEAGVTLWLARVADGGNTGLQLARSLGRFAGAEVPARPWHARGLLRQRLSMVERRGGWRTLARTTVADVAALLWSRRAGVLDALDELPQVPQHGDPVPANLLGRDGDDVVAVDWSTFGLGPVGADVGYLSLSAREAFEPLLEVYVAGLPDGVATPEQVAVGARAMAVYTVLTRADWALARVADGEGALAGKYRHPSVAPYLRAMQRQLPQIEALLGEGTVR